MDLNVEKDEDNFFNSENLSDLSGIDLGNEECFDEDFENLKTKIEMAPNNFLLPLEEVVSVLKRGLTKE
jgi:hypothetical protein